jgi:hypothetical protein
MNLYFEYDDDESELKMYSSAICNEVFEKLLNDCNDCNHTYKLFKLFNVALECIDEIYEKNPSVSDVNVFYRLCLDGAANELNYRKELKNNYFSAEAEWLHAKNGLKCAKANRSYYLSIDMWIERVQRTYVHFINLQNECDKFELLLPINLMSE